MSPLQDEFDPLVVVGLWLMPANGEISMRCSNCTTSGRLWNATAGRSRKVSWYSRSASTAWP